jgi:O-antigen/teichoic acid export membrane protein
MTIDGPKESSRITDEYPHPQASASSSPPFSPILPRFSIQVAWTFAARILMIFNSVAAGIIVARWLGAEGVGQLAVINVSVATIVQLGSLGLPSANTYFIARDRNHLASAAINSLLFSFVVGSALALGLAELATLRPAWFGFVSPQLIGIAAISIPFQLLALIGLNIFLALGQLRQFNLLDLIGQSSVLLNSLIALVILNRGLGTLVSLNTAASVVVSFCVAILLVSSARKLRERWTPGSRKWRADLSLMRKMMRYGLKFHISILAGALIFRADLLVVNHFRGAAEAGVYSVASQVAMMLMLLPAVIATLLFPRVTAEQERGSELTCRTTRHTTFVMLLICLAAIPGSFALPLLYGAAFKDVSIQLWILLPGVFLIGIEAVLVQYFTATGLPFAIPIFWLLTLVINLCLVFALVPTFGARGAALASTVSYSLVFALVAYYFCAKTGMPMSSFLFLRRNDWRKLKIV